MDRRQDISGIGERVRIAVQDAVESGDFGQINELVKDTAGNALEEFRYQAGQLQERFGNMREFSERTKEQYPKRQRVQEIRKLSKRYLNKGGKASGILLTIFGGIGVGVFGVLTGVLLLETLLSWSSAAAAVTAFFSLVLMVCAVFLKKGCGIRARLKKAERYLQLMRGNRHVNLEDLAARAGQNVKQIRKEVRGMLRAGIFPEGHMDEKEELFVLDDETWEQYLTVRRQWHEVQRTVSVSSGKDEDSDEKQQKSSEMPDASGAAEEIWMEQEGREYVDRLRQLNAQIPGERISNKLYQLDLLLRRIFAVLKEQPKRCPQTRKFMDYYLPTTVKLVESYADFDQSGVNSEQIRTAKAEIEKTLDTINQAFEKLLEDLYQEAAMEASADAKVLKTILAQDGYTEDGFTAAAEKEGKK